MNTNDVVEAAKAVVEAAKALTAVFRAAKALIEFVNVIARKRR